MWQQLLNEKELFLLNAVMHKPHILHIYLTVKQYKIYWEGKAKWLYMLSFYIPVLHLP